MHDEHSATPVTDVDYWDYFYAPVIYGDYEGGVLVAIRHVNSEYLRENQIYGWNHTKRSNFGRPAVFPQGTVPVDSSVAPNNNMTEAGQIVNGVEDIGEESDTNKEKAQRWSAASGLQLPSSALSKPNTIISEPAEKSNSVAENSQSELSTHDLSQTETPQFKRWFGNSKTVDRAGKPKHYFHGTDATFDAFRPDYRGAIWLTDNENVAARFSGKGANSRVLQVFTRAENPMVVTVGFDENWDIDKTVQDAKAAGHDGLIIKFANGALRDNSYYQFMLENHPDKLAADVFKTVKNAPPAEIAGDMTIAEFDATLGADGATHEYVAVFDPTQVKSATSNVGTFDRSNPKYDYSTHDLGTSDEATSSKQTPALDLFDRGLDAADYYRESSANGTFDPKVAAELSSIRLRNGLREGGRLSDAEIPRGAMWAWSLRESTKAAAAIGICADGANFFIRRQTHDGNGVDLRGIRYRGWACCAHQSDWHSPSKAR